MNIKKLLKPNKIAVVGASEKTGFGSDTCRNVMKYMSPDKYYFISPTRASVFGVPCFKSMADLPEQVDLMVVCTPKPTVNGILEEGAAAGARAAVIFASGYGEVDEQGKEDEKELIALCKKLDMPIMGPNCGGYINTVDKIFPFAFVSEDRDRTGGIGLVSQSGQFVLSMMDNPVPGFSYGISSGNSKVVTMEDYLEFLVEDPDTRVVALYLEGVNDPKRFIAALKRAAEIRKPVVVHKVGRSEKGQQVAASHTGSMAGADRVYDALFEKFGVIRVDDLQELMSTAQALAVLKKLPKGNGLTSANLSGGETGISADIAHLNGLEYPDYDSVTVEKLRAMLPSYAHVSNPLDMTATLAYSEEALTEAYGTIMKDPNVDLMLVGFTLLENVVDPCVDYIAHAVERLAKEEWSVPVMILPYMENTRNPEYVKRLADLGVPILPPPAYAFKIVKNILKFAAYDVSQKDLNLCFPGKGRPAGEALTETASKMLIRDRIPCGRFGVAATRQETGRLFESLGLEKAVVKVESPDILHKSDAGCVKLNIRNAKEAEEAFDAILANAKAYDAGARIEGVQVCEMMKPGTELIIGVKNDPQFGPCVLCGLGGIYVEVFKDTALGLAPLSIREAGDMIDSLKSVRLLDGYRGQPALDKKAFADALVEISRFACAHTDEMAELDINPVFLYEKGLCAVDALYIKG
ncbi:MAG: acetate--CoA ligase family protein [Eubacteriales bacterium]|nr:acetate--CoA ligase family protein [Eubacteriales bacterium]